MTTLEVSGKHAILPETKDQRCFNAYATCGTRLLLLHRRKRNKKYKLLQSYLPLLGWGFLSLLAIILAFREHRFSGARHTLREAHKDMQSLQNQQVQMQVMFAINAEVFQLLYQNFYACKVSASSSNVLNCDTARNNLAGHFRSPDQLPLAMCTTQWETRQHAHVKSLVVLAMLSWELSSDLCRRQAGKRIKASGSSTQKSFKQKGT